MRRTRVLYRLHKWIGLTTAVFIAVLYLTGVVLVWDRPLPPSAAPDGNLAPLIAAVERLYPDSRIDGLQTGNPVQVFLAQGKDYLQVAVDPHTLRPVNGGVAPWRGIIRLIHIRLYFFGSSGRYLVGFFGLTVLLSAVSGLWIYGPFTRSLLSRWHIRPHPQLAISDIHKLVGLLSAVFHLLIGLSGAALGLLNFPQLAPRPKPALAVTKLDGRITADEAMHRAVEAMEGLRPTAILMPSGRSPQYTIYGDTNPLLRPSASFVTVHATSGLILDKYDARLASAAALAWSAAGPLHFGSFGGQWVRVLYLLFGFAGATLPFTGLWLAARKRRLRATLWLSPHNSETHR